MSASKRSTQQFGGASKASDPGRQTRPASGAQRAKKVPTRWLIERGATRASAAVDVRGGFPGGIRVGNVLERVPLVVSARYLAIGEGANSGFALRLHELGGAGLVRPGRQVPPSLVVRYQDDDVVRTFGVTFRGLARTFSGRWRAEEVLQALEEGGVPVTDESAIAGPPRFGVSWEAARAWADEELRWSGTATAPVGGWFGLRRRPCTVWLTGSSLFWSHREGAGVNRLALADVADVQAGPHPTLVVSTTDGLGHRYDLPFTIERPAKDLSPEDQLGAFVETLREAGVAITAASTAFAPWVRGAAPR